MMTLLDAEETETRDSMPKKTLITNVRTRLHRHPQLEAIKLRFSFAVARGSGNPKRVDFSSRYDDIMWI